MAKVAHLDVREAGGGGHQSGLPGGREKDASEACHDGMFYCERWVAKYERGPNYAAMKRPRSVDRRKIRQQSLVRKHRSRPRRSCPHAHTLAGLLHSTRALPDSARI